MKKELSHVTQKGKQSIFVSVESQNEYPLEDLHKHFGILELTPSVPKI